MFVTVLTRTAPPWTVTIAPTPAVATPAAGTRTPTPVPAAGAVMTASPTPGYYRRNTTIDLSAALCDGDNVTNRASGCGLWRIHSAEAVVFRNCRRGSIESVSEPLSYALMPIGIDVEKRVVVAVLIFVE